MGFTLLGILNSQAARAQVPEPAFLTSAPLWLDAADASTITASSGSVSQWDNKGTLENFVQATSADQPTTGTQTLNGLNVLDFASEFMTGQTSSNWKFMHDGTDYFVCAVCKIGSEAGDTNQYGLVSNVDSSSQVGFDITYKGSFTNTIQHFVGRGVQGSFVVNNVPATGFSNSGQFTIVSVLADPNNGTAANRSELFNNNGSAVKNNTATNSVSTANPTFDLTVGANLPSGFKALIGQIGEVIVVRGADATESNRQEVVDYLNAKWSVFV